VVSYMLLYLMILAIVMTKEIDSDKAMLSLQMGNEYFLKGDIDNSISSYKQAISLDPNYISAYSNLGNALKDKGSYDESIDIHTKAITLDPNNHKLYYNLGVVLQLKMQYNDAIVAYRHSISLNPNHVNSIYNIGLTYQEIGNLDEAMSLYLKVLEFDPYHISARLNYCNILMAANNKLTERCYLDVLAIDPHHVKGLINLASYYQSQIDYDNVAVTKLYEKVIKIDPSNVMATKGLQALTGDIVENSDLDATYARELFDSYSFIFEDSLMKLKYNSHQIIAQALSKYGSNYLLSENFQILDLGCGTGLACSELRKHLPLNNSTRDIVITGVDISPKMLAIAEKKECYNYTVTDDITNYVENEKNKYHIILAADVFVYIGELHKLLSNCRRISLPNSLLVFTVENGDVDKRNEDNFFPQLSGRYAHKKRYLDDISRETGWSLIELTEISGREDKGKPVAGYLVILKT